MAWAARLLAPAAGAAACLAAASAAGHPTPAERAREAEQRAACARPVPPAEDLDPVRPGMAEEELRTLFPAEALELEAPPDDEAPSGSDARSDVRVLEREGAGDLARVHYDLWRGRVVRVRWRLAERFERPVLDALVDKATICFGPPRIDQTFPAEPGSPAVTYRRVVWEHGERRIELRQLHPLRGGAVHLAVGSRPALRAMREAGVAPRPLPETTAPWWTRGAAPVVPPTPEEAEALGRDFLALLAHAAH